MESSPYLIRNLWWTHNEYQKYLNGELNKRSISKRFAQFFKNDTARLNYRINNVVGSDSFVGIPLENCQKERV